jgi:hypothetical protein
VLDLSGAQHALLDEQLTDLNASHEWLLLGWFDSPLPLISAIAQRA